MGLQLAPLNKRGERRWTTVFVPTIERDAHRSASFAAPRYPQHGFVQAHSLASKFI
ncbi:hypothetical protein BQ8482_270004 [Mesorhizobium delmotii]|uniref:Uncharacterized protein n=1 Tax=Mesorhizobium delmotii TaxID=1631247 RepID=A0A2P9AM91_9HYPH|nr:hypothetical protein BQ8482_270004 [Mesorhizobium delmotii]